MENGLIHIYCGDGKGKSTAAAGLAVRAAGAGLKVLFARFLKTEHSAELAPLSGISLIDILPITQEFGFIRSKDNPVVSDARKYYSGYFDAAVTKAVEDNYDLLILDEINAAVSLGIVPKEKLIHFLINKPKKLEIVITGRNPSEEIIELADYVSEIKKIKHPYDRGILARRGIEY